MLRCHRMVIKAATPSPPAGRFDLSAVLWKTAGEAASLEAKLAGEEFVPGQVLVKFRDQVDATGLSQDYGAKLLHQFAIPTAIAASFGGSLALLQMPDGISSAQAIAALGHDPRVEYADTNDIVHACGPTFPNDLDDRQWGLHNPEGPDIEAPEAWSISTGSTQGPIVAVLDSGIDYSHSELAANMWVNPQETDNDLDDDGNGLVDDIHGANFVADSGDPMDDWNHGTHVAGVIAAKGDNHGGIVGVNWQARLMAVKFLGGSGGGTIADAVRAVLYATEKGARITNNSWSGTKHNQAMEDALRASPALHICAAGNDGYDNDQRPVYPASYELDNVVSVAAHDREDRLASFSNRGERSVDLAAPGVDIYSTIPGGYDSLSGTSMAAPFVTGVAALIAARYPEADNQAIVNRLMTGVEPMPRYHDRLVSGGRLNAARALEVDEQAPDPPADFRVTTSGARSVNLAWTATGDDGVQGQAVQYDLRYSNRPIVDAEPQPGEITFDEAAPVGLQPPGTPGTLEATTLTLPPSSQERTLYFALKVVDNVGNRSKPATTEARIGPTPVVFEDTADGDASAWEVEGSWVQVESPGRGKVWTESPDRAYGPNRDDKLTSRTISLDGWKDAVLHFDAAFDTEEGYDGCDVEVYGTKWWRTTWRREARLEGRADWANHRVDLSDYDGQDVKIRFRFHSDDSRQRDGVSIDNVVVTGERTGGRLQDPPSTPESPD